VRIFELEAGGEQPSGDDAAALEDQLRLGADEDGADLEQPRGVRQAERHPHGGAQLAHTQRAFSLLIPETFIAL
jgi:hypothetical protein